MIAYPPFFVHCGPPRPENYPGARIGANVPTSSKVFGSQKLLTSIFSTKGALRRHVTYNNHPNLTYGLLARHNRPQKASNFSNPDVIATFVVFFFKITAGLTR